ncbi:MAG: AMIN domain-containing protein [Bdellovibrionales bacterium]|nr:AMIN domain-containing protein [Bdellovibrionales bacterium]
MARIRTFKLIRTISIVFGCWGILYGSPPQGFAQAPIAELHAGELHLSVLDSDGQYVLLLATDEATTPPTSPGVDANIFTLRDPPRIVIDLPKKLNVTKEALRISHPVFSQLRVGSHPTKTRIVLDLKGTEVPRYRLRQDPAGGNWMLSVWFPEAPSPAGEEPTMVAKSPSAPTSTTTPRAGPVKSATLRPSEPKAPAVRAAKPRTTRTSPATHPTARALPPRVPPRTPVVPNIPFVRARLLSPTTTGKYVMWQVPGGVIIRIRPSASEAAPQRLEHQAEVKSVEYARSADGALDTIEVEIAELQSYALERLDERQYVLKLFYANPEPALETEANCAPPGTTGLQAIVAKSQHGHTVLDIYVDRGTLLTARRTRKGLLLTATE